MVKEGCQVTSVKASLLKAISIALAAEVTGGLL